MKIYQSRWQGRTCRRIELQAKSKKYYSITITNDTKERVYVEIQDKNKKSMCQTLDVGEKWNPFGNIFYYLDTPVIIVERPNQPLYSCIATKKNEGVGQTGNFDSFDQEKWNISLNNLAGTCSKTNNNYSKSPSSCSANPFEKLPT